jgi:predicted DNA-binding transcriptional regulator AlpA
MPTDPIRVRTLDELVRDPGLAPTLTAAERTRVLVQVAAVLAALAIPTIPTIPEIPEREITPDRLLTAEQAAARTGLTVQQLKSRRLPFKRKLGHRTVRFSERGLDRWMRRAGA